jgi:hypothetical protein
VPRFAVVLARADALCARLNGGLTAVALVLTIMTAALSLVRAAEWLGPYEIELSTARVAR